MVTNGTLERIWENSGLLEKIISIKGVGLLHDANGSNYTLKRATLMYADNGRGKSTLASIVRSCSQDDANLITSRQTIGGQNPQEIRLLFGSSHPVNYANGAWTEARNEILVFDADFVEQNVYSGGQISTSQRMNLLQFALGAHAVNAQQEYDQANQQHRIDNANVIQVEQTLRSHHSGLSLEQFEKIQPLANVDAVIAGYTKQIEDATNIAAIQAMPVPASPILPVADISSILEICARSIEQIDTDAETKVKEHIAKHQNGNIENWISQGSNYEQNNQCPYCDQSIEGVEIVAAYKTYFNQEYRSLKFAVADIPRQIEQLVGDAVHRNFVSQFQGACTAALAWQRYVQITLPVIDEQAMARSLAAAKQIMEEILALKSADILTSITDATYSERFDQAWQYYLSALHTAKQQMDAIITDINNYKSSLAQANLPELNQNLSNAQWAKKRHEQVIIDLINDLNQKRAARTASAKVKQDKKDALNLIMTRTLDTYQSNINRLLASFGASFKISDLDYNYRGNAPRSDYVLEMRGANISMGGAAPDFRTSLSESDKRTFAFAFFIASVQADPNLANKIVVIDDPICSLDLNRQHQTRVILKWIHDNCSQLIVLAHDANFLRRLKKDILRSSNLANTSCISLKVAANDYSEFCAIDLEQECETGYFKNHRDLEDYLTGNNLNHMHIARSIRPMLEGYLHRRFPGKISAGLLFGQVVQGISGAQSPSPLIHAQNITQELNDINTYAGQFHHDTNPAADQMTVNPGELRQFVIRSLELIHKGTA